MFPIGDDEVVGGPFPIVNVIIIILNFLVFLVVELPLSPDALQAFFQTWAVVPLQIQQGQGLLTLFTAMFLHGGWAHILGNMVFLYVFGHNIEDTLGHLGYLIFYLVGGLVAGFTHILFNLGSDIPSLGASGAIAAVMGAYIVLFPNGRVRVLMITPYLTTGTVSALAFLGIWAVTQLFSGVASLGASTAQTDGVAVWAHVGGFIFGVIVGFLVRSVKGTPQISNRY